MTPQELRIQRMKEAGIPMPITQVPLSEGAASAIPVTVQNADKHARLQALKSGANRHQLQSLVKAKTAQNSFQGIPEPTKNRRPQAPGQQTASENKIPVQNFQAQTPVSSEFAAMESMFGGEPSSASINMSMSPAPVDTTQPDLSINQDGYGPAFDPAGMIAKKRAEMRTNNQYMQYAVAPVQQQDYTENLTDQQNFDFQYMQKMMQEIAKNTISEVLNSYTEKNKDKITYENVAKSKDGAQIVKAQDGQYYKLVPVKIKK